LSLYPKILIRKNMLTMKRFTRSIVETYLFKGVLKGGGIYDLVVRLCNHKVSGLNPSKGS